MGLTLCEYVNLDTSELESEDVDKIENAVKLIVKRLKENNFEDFDDDERSIMEAAYEVKEVCDI